MWIPWFSTQRRMRRPALRTDPHDVDLPGIGLVHVTCTVDCIGDACPRPQLLTLRALNQVACGEIVELVSDNPATVETIPAMIYTIAGTHLATTRENGRWHVYLRKDADFRMPS